MTNFERYIIKTLMVIQIQNAIMMIGRDTKAEDIRNTQAIFNEAIKEQQNALEQLAKEEETE